MDKKPDIGFEYDYIRIVYEVITLKLRTNKKIIEKEINYISNKLQGIKKKPGSINENVQLIKNLITKTDNLQKKVKNSLNQYDEICREEEFMYNCLHERLNQLQLIDDNNYNFENLKGYFTKKLNHLLLDFFLREKFLDTAKYFIEEEKINVNILRLRQNSVEYSIFIEIQKILENLHKKDINDALKWCSTNKNKLTKLNSNIEFKLLKQQFIEIYKKGNNLETVKFARENFANFSNHDEIKEIMLLLAIKPDLINKIQRISVIMRPNIGPFI